MPIESVTMNLKRTPDIAKFYPTKLTKREIREEAKREVICVLVSHGEDVSRDQPEIFEQYAKIVDQIIKRFG